MKRKKSIKQLMALGIPRNDAAGFVSTCNALKAAGKKIILPEIMAPPIATVPPICTDYQIRKFATTILLSNKYDFLSLPQNADDQYMQKKLAKEMGLALLDAGAIKVTVTELPPNNWYGDRRLEYRATINVAMEVQ